MRFASLILLLSLASCDRITWELEEHLDIGRSCVQGGDETDAIVRVNAGVCLSSSCSRQIEASCVAEVDGDQVVVTSSFAWEEASARRLACTADCGFMIAECSAGALPAGTYTVSHAEESYEVTLPAEPCDPEFEG